MSRLRRWARGVIEAVLLRLGLKDSLLGRETGRIARFLMAGLATVLVNLGTLYVLTEYGHLWYLGSSILDFVISYGVNFTLQKFWTFRSRDARATRRQLPLHFSLALFNLAFKCNFNLIKL